MASLTTAISSFVCWPYTMPVSRHSCEEPIIKENLYLYDADGKVYQLLDDEDFGARKELGPWGSTLDATYGQLRFDQITGWSRWLKLNQQEPNLECFVEPYTAIWYDPKGRK